MKLLWDPVIKTSKDGNGMYGLGWAVMESKEEYAFAKKQRFFTSHTGRFQNYELNKDYHEWENSK